MRAAVPTTMQGRNLENVATAVDCETYRQPIGVFGAICPFNFPAMVPMWFLPFAVACGNTFVLKPSEQVPLAQEAIFQLIHDIELLPPGVINLVHGSREVVEGICDHPGIAGVSFVGSATVAKLVYERSARAGKRVQALGGAKNHMVVMPDAVVDKTVDNIIGSAFGAAGQRCMAGSSLVTVGSAHERVVPALIEAAEKLRVGNGLEKGVGVGPLVSGDGRDIVRSLDRQGRRRGRERRRSTAATRRRQRLGRVRRADDPGRRHARTWRSRREEIFGPVLSVVKVDTLTRRSSSSTARRYGNGSSIFTESGAVARRYRHDCDAGMIGVNIGVAAPVAFFPFSGWKDSFLGDLHAHGGDAIDFYTRKTTVTSRWYSDGEDREVLRRVTERVRSINRSSPRVVPRSSRGLGRWPLTPVTRVRIPYAVPRTAPARAGVVASPARHRHRSRAGRAPPGCEQQARASIGGLLGLPEIEKPEALAARGGCWFACGAQQLHVGVAIRSAAATKAHPALAVRDVEALEGLLAELGAAGCETRRDVDLPGLARGFVDDPFGNRIELVAPLA